MLILLRVTKSNIKICLCEIGQIVFLAILSGRNKVNFLNSNFQENWRRLSSTNIWRLLNYSLTIYNQNYIFNEFDLKLILKVVEDSFCPIYNFSFFFCSLYSFIYLAENAVSFPSFLSFFSNFSLCTFFPISFYNCFYSHPRWSSGKLKIIY